MATSAKAWFPFIDGNSDSLSFLTICRFCLGPPHLHHFNKSLTHKDIIQINPTNRKIQACKDPCSIYLSQGQTSQWNGILISCNLASDASSSTSFFELLPFQLVEVSLFLSLISLPFLSFYTFRLSLIQSFFLLTLSNFLSLPSMPDMKGEVSTSYLCLLSLFA